MEKAALQLLPPLNKLEKLLGHGLGISEPILKQRVSDAISKHLTTLNLNVVEIEPTKVDWSRIIHNSAYRLPPFEHGEKEKGFRDAMIIESLRQLIDQSPVTPSVCRIVLVTEDKLLRQAAEEIASGVQNVRIVQDLEELKGLINTLVSEVGEDFISELTPKAQAIFFIKEDKSTLYYKDEIRKKINDQFSAELASMPDGVTELESNTWFVGKPRFVKKSGQRIFWVNRIEATFNGYRDDPNTSSRNYDDGLLGLRQSQGGLASLAGIINTAGSEKTLIREYSKVFDIDWSVTLGQHKKFSTPKVEEIRFVETKFKETGK